MCPYTRPNRLGTFNSAHVHRSWWGDFALDLREGEDLMPLQDQNESAFHCSPWDCTQVQRPAETRGSAHVGVVSAVEGPSRHFDNWRVALAALESPVCFHALAG